MDFWAKFLPFVFLYSPVIVLQFFQCRLRRAAEVKLNLGCCGAALSPGGAVCCWPCSSIPLCVLLLALVQAEGESLQENNLAEDETLLSFAGLVFSQNSSFKFPRSCGDEEMYMHG